MSVSRRHNNNKTFIEPLEKAAEDGSNECFLTFKVPSGKSASTEKIQHYKLREFWQKWPTIRHNILVNTKQYSFVDRKGGALLCKAQPYVCSLYIPFGSNNKRKCFFQITIASHYTIDGWRTEIECTNKVALINTKTYKLELLKPDDCVPEEIQKNIKEQIEILLGKERRSEKKLAEEELLRTIKQAPDAINERINTLKAQYIKKIINDPICMSKEELKKDLYERYKDIEKQKIDERVDKFLDTLQNGKSEKDHNKYTQLGIIPVTVQDPEQQTADKQYVVLLSKENDFKITSFKVQRGTNGIRMNENAFFHIAPQELKTLLKKRRVTTNGRYKYQIKLAKKNLGSSNALEDSRSDENNSNNSSSGKTNSIHSPSKERIDENSHSNDIKDQNSSSSGLNALKSRISRGKTPTEKTKEY